MKVHKEWKESNPLRMYRKENDLTIGVIASALGVGEYTIQRWESGSVKPNEQNIEKLRFIIGEDAADQWQKWIDNRPKL